MVGFHKEKQITLGFHDALDRATQDELDGVFARFTDENLIWRGYHPLGEIHGRQATVRQFWQPLRAAMTNLHRRTDIFFAGRNQIDGFSSVWVVSMGHLVGLFDNPFLGVPPTGRMAFLRYGEFNRVENGRIAETAIFFDLPHLMIQAGLRPFPEGRGTHLVQPGPHTHDGLILASAPPEEGEQTLATINAMISDLGEWNSGIPLTDELRRTWAENMIWWGPAGIGATYTINRYAEQHAGPFRAAFSDRSRTGHICRLAEGHYGGFFGWPNFRARLTGDFMGRSATGRTGEFRVIDIYRRAGDRLAENWVFIDLPHFWMQQGVDILGDALNS